MLASGIADRPAYKWWVFSAVALGTLASVVNHGGMSVALPTIARHFNADLATAQWVIIAEGLAISALILPMGRLSDVLGRKRVLIAGMSLFSAGAALVSVSPGIGYLIAFMALQGLGAAMLQGTAIAIVTSVFPEDERGKGMGRTAAWQEPGASWVPLWADSLSPRSTGAGFSM
ncbi:MAG: MFS transporter [Dehalococcoidia bacterium]|nr:MFS transporter [Dehalococcoidia bacterium]